MRRLAQLVIVVAGSGILASPCAAQEGFYGLGQQRVELRRIAAAGEQVADPDNWQQLPDLGQRQRVWVSKQVELGPEDILGIEISQHPQPTRNRPYLMTVQIKRTAWDRLESLNDALREQRIVVVRHHAVIPAGAPLSKTEVEQLIDGLVPGQAPDQGAVATAYRQWLAQWVEDHPDDGVALWRLVEAYRTSGHVSDCETIPQLLERIAPAAELIPGAIGSIADCYANAAAYPRAIDLYRQAIETGGDDEAGLRIRLADVYWATGDQPQAVDQLEQAQTLLREVAAHQTAMAKDVEQQLRRYRTAQRSRPEQPAATARVADSR